MKDVGLEDLRRKIKEIGFQTSPRSAAEAADMFYNTRAERLELQHQIDDLAARETALKEFFINSLPKSQASGIAGKVARVQLGAKVVPL